MAWCSGNTMPTLTAVEEGLHCCAELLTQLSNYVRIGGNGKLPGGNPRSCLLYTSPSPRDSTSS
eukprot:6159197-Prorocentrum_lima.AAC.1